MTMMNAAWQTPFSLAPRYRLDDENPWLMGIDPMRRYWIALNGDPDRILPIPGLMMGSFEEFRDTILAFRRLNPGEMLQVESLSGSLSIICITDNCFAITAEIEGADVWHLFDQETLDSLLMTAHPDWHCSPRDLELARKLLAQTYGQPVAV